MRNTVQRHDRKGYSLIEITIGEHLIYMRVPDQGDTIELDHIGKRVHGELTVAETDDGIKLVFPTNQ